MGFPIRKSSDQSSFAAPQGLSQRTTSFIASQRQGIHRMLLRHLIALMIDVRRSAADADSIQKDHWLPNLSVREHACRTHPITGAVEAIAGRRAMSRLPTVGYIPSSRCQTPAATPYGRDANCSFDSGHVPRAPPRHPGGARRDRTDDLMLAKHALSQLSYGPDLEQSGSSAINGGPGTTRTSDLTLIRGAL